MKKILFFLFAAVLAAGGVEAQEAADSMKIFYRRGYRNVDLSFRDNRAQMERFLNLTEAALKNDRVEKVVIRSYASPDGTAEANERLSVGRAEELKAYLVREGNIPASFAATPKGWSGKRGSNPPPPPWQGGALPNELFPHIKINLKVVRAKRLELIHPAAPEPKSGASANSATPADALCNAMFHLN